MAGSTCLHTLHAYCAAYKRPNLQTFTPEELGLNNLESLRLYQVYPLGALEVPVLQLKTSLRATSIFNMPSAAALCRTPTRNTPHLFIS